MFELLGHHGTSGGNVHSGGYGTSGGNGHGRDGGGVRVAVPYSPKYEGPKYVVGLTASTILWLRDFEPAAKAEAVKPREQFR